MDQLLWQDVSILAQRDRKARAALMAVGRVIRDQRPLKGGEEPFLSALDHFLTQPDSLLNKLTRDPYFYFWCRLGYDLLFVLLNPSETRETVSTYMEKTGRDIEASLTRHLADFERLRLGAAIRSGSTLQLPVPLEVETPITILGTDIVIHADRPLSFLGAQHGQPLIDDESARVETCKTFNRGDWSVMLNASVFNVPLKNIQPALINASLDQLPSTAQRLGAAVEVLARTSPAEFDQLQQVVSHLAFWQNEPGKMTFNLSHSDLPGALAVYPYENAYELANALLHEYLHNRLFMLEEEVSLLASSNTDQDSQGYYSPWRSDRRPMHGLFHACYVFTGISAFWTRVLRHPDTDEAMREICRTRIMSGLRQVELGFAQLKRHANLTEGGSDILQRLMGDHAELRSAAFRLGLAYDMDFSFLDPDRAKSRGEPALTIDRMLMKHLKAYASYEEIDFLAPILETAA